MENRGVLRSLLYHFFTSSVTAAKEVTNSAITKSDWRVEVFIALGKAILFLGCILAFVSASAVKIIFRKNYGPKSIDLALLACSILIFYIIAFLGLVFSVAEPFKDNYFFLMNGTLTFFFYTSLAIYLSRKWYEIWKKRDSNDYFEGDSLYLGDLVKAGWKEKNVKIYAEPFLIIAIGIFLMAFIGLFAIPILFCGISIWVYEITAAIIKYNPTQTIIENRKYGAGSSEIYTVNKDRLN